MTTTVRVGELQIAYERVGDGPPLVLLHGILCDRRVWRRQIPALSKGLTVVAWDAPGCGRSSDPPESFRMDEYADVLAGFLEALALGNAHVLGHSLGATLALAFYRRHPAHVASLILANGYAGWKGSLPPAVCAERLDTCLRQSSLPPAEFIPSWMPGVMSEHASPELVQEFAAMMADFHPAGFRAMAHALAEADERAVLGRIDVPTLLVWGNVDQRAPLTIATQLRDAIPGAALAIVPGAGHASQFERAEPFNVAVQAFLRQHAPSRS
jgi:pimeloyl-ACP methyl ester carboxylesterase